MIDSHHHFWAYDPQEYPWMGEGMDVLKSDHLPADLRQAIAGTGIEGVVSVQARQELKETDWLLELAAENDLVKGVVGWVPLRDEGIGKILEQYEGNPWLKGVRHVIQDEPDPDFILGEEFNRGVKELKGRELVYDILVFHFHLPQTIQFVDRHPDQLMVLDHIAKPVVDPAKFAQEWARQLKELARREHVSCKFSGVVTEVIGSTWDEDLIKPYFETALEAFGPERLMYGSDWPVCRLQSEYERWFSCVDRFVGELSESEQSAIMAGNAKRVYQLSC